jgi:hypothetical protein
VDGLATGVSGCLDLEGHKTLKIWICGFSLAGTAAFPSPGIDFGLVRGDAVSNVVLVTVLLLDLVGVGILFRVLRLHPAPVFRRRSLRREARKTLLPARRRQRWRIQARDARREHPELEYLPYVGLAALLWAPLLGKLVGLDQASLYFGPFETPRDSREFLQTLWQVVAAAVGLSVAMIAFAFEAFMGSAQRQFGGSLREFANQTHLLRGIRFGVLALLVDGAVLLGLGVDAPYGWAAMWGTALSAFTLIQVLRVIQGTILNLGQQRLLSLRRRHLEQVVDAALRRQLLSQAAEIVLARGDFPALQRGWFGEGGAELRAQDSGLLHDIWLGPLARLAVRHRQISPSMRIVLRVGLGEEIDDGAVLAEVPTGTSGRDKARVRRQIRLRGPEDEAPDRELTDQIARLHGIALTAVRERQIGEWRQIGALYELVLLALPRAAAELEIPFAGAVAAPGVFGFGPMQKIADNLYKEMEAALDVNDAAIADAIAYLPGKVAREARRLGALEVAHTMLELYPAIYAAGSR